MRIAKQFLMTAGIAVLAVAISAPLAKDIPPPETGGVNPRTSPAPAVTGEPSALPALVVVPASFRIENLADGCYVLFFERTHFEGNRLNIVGPVELRTMEAPFGAKFVGLSSAVIGPRARVIAYDDTDFEQDDLLLEPGQQVADFKNSRGKGRLGLFEKIKSLRVTCTS